MADKKVTIDIEINADIEPTIANLKVLKKQLKETAAGSEEFKKIYNQIDDLEDKIKSAKNTSSDWIDSLESAGGPIGVLGAGLNKAKVATQSFGAALKATGIGLIVALIAGLVAAIGNSERATKKLQPVLEGFQRILNGVFAAIEPLFDALIDLATKAMPYVTEGFKVAYSAISSFLQDNFILLDKNKIPRLSKPTNDFSGSLDMLLALNKRPISFLRLVYDFVLRISLFSMESNIRF